MLGFMLHISHKALHLFLRITPKGRCHEYGQVLERLSVWPVSLEEVTALREELRSSGDKLRALSVPTAPFIKSNFISTFEILSLPIGNKSPSSLKYNLTGLKSVTKYSARHQGIHHLVPNQQNQNTKILGP